MNSCVHPCRDTLKFEYSSVCVHFYRGVWLDTGVVVSYTRSVYTCERVTGVLHEGGVRKYIIRKQLVAVHSP